MTSNNGLPRATRTFQFNFTLNGAAANPTAIQGEFYRFDKAGRKVVIKALVQADFISGGGTGQYTVTVTPDTYGEFFIRAWTSGDVKTDDAEKSFTVPKPGLG